MTDKNGNSGSSNNKNNKPNSSPQLNIPPPLLPPKLDDCDRPACDDTVSALTAAFQRVQQQKQATSPTTATNTNNTSNNPYKAKSPPNKDLLGKSTWNLLHSMVAWYPDIPSNDDEVFMNQFMNSLGRFYPCTYCAHDFQIELKKNPPRTKSRKELSIWLCEQHNIVNKKIGKPIFPCDISTLDRRWRKNEGA